MGVVPGADYTTVPEMYWKSITFSRPPLEGKMDMTTGNSCTDTATMRKRRQTATGMPDKHQTIEEPGEGKLSRTVLKPSRGGDIPA